MFFGEEDSPFQNLPPEMIVEVKSHVDLDGKKSARLVCRRWRWILDHPNSGLVSFKQTKGKITEDSVQCLLKSQLHFDHLVLEDLKMTWPAMSYSRNKFPHIRKLTLKSGNSDQSLTTILQYGCSQTESLTLAFDCFSHVRLHSLSGVLSGMRWNQLTELILDVNPHIEFPGVKSLKNSLENNVKGMELVFKKARIPNLRALTLYLLFKFGNNELCGEVVKMMSNFMIFLEHHSKTLKELKLCLFSSSEEILVFPEISAPLFPMEQQISIARDLELGRLDIWTTHFDAQVRLENLTNLNWHPLWGQFWSLPPPGGNSGIWTPIIARMPALMAPPNTTKPMGALIQQNKKSLTNVTIRFINGDNDVDPFEISWLQSCPHLRELTISNCNKLFSVELQLPTVRKLDIGIMGNFQMENLSTWISRTFRNLETVQFSIYFPTQLQNWELDWIQNLLLLPRLGEIRFGFSYWLFQYKISHLPFTGQNLIREYCSNKASLMFRGEIQRQRGRQDHVHHSELCFIKILPNRN